MLNIGPAEIVVILVLALLVFGPSRLPEMGRSLGRTVRDFRKATESVTKELGVDEVLREVNDVKQTVVGGFDDVKKTVAEPINDVKKVVTGPVEDVRDGLKIDLGAHDDEALTGEVVDEAPPAASGT